MTLRVTCSHASHLCELLVLAEGRVVSKCAAEHLEVGCLFEDVKVERQFTVRFEVVHLREDVDVRKLKVEHAAEREHERAQILVCLC